MAAKKKERGQDLEAEIAGREHETCVIRAPNLQHATFKIVGTSPLMINAFPSKARAQMKAKQEAGSKGRKGVAREAKDFQACYEGAFHRSREGWAGIAAPSFRNAMISACRLVGFKMTIAKLSVFACADGFDVTDGMPLVRIYGDPIYTEMPVRNESGVADIRARPMWPEWSCNLRVKYDADQFTAADVANLVLRAGEQVGVGEARHDSKKSAGLGYGCFAFAK